MQLLQEIYDRNNLVGIYSRLFTTGNSLVGIYSRLHHTGNQNDAIYNYLYILSDVVNNYVKVM
jgi:hypothetical protein